MIISPIVGLFLPCRPTTVFEAVVPKGVFTVDACVTFPVALNMLIVRFVHVSLEVLERLPKAFNSFCSVVFERLVVFVRTARNHRFINTVERMALRHSMSDKARSVLLVPFTPTTYLGFGTKMTSPNNSEVSAGTTAKPLNISLLGARRGYNSQPSVNLSHFVRGLHIMNQQCV